MSTLSENDEVREILHNVVAESSRRLYNANNVNLLLWIYKNPSLRSQLLAPWILPLLDEANEQEVTLNAKGRIRKVLKKAIEAMAPDLENSPILLENMNFEVFSKFVVSKKQNKSKRQKQREKRKRKRRRCNQNGDGDQQEQGNVEQGNVEQGNVEQEDANLTFMSKSCYDGYRSALAHLYRVSNIVMPNAMAKQLSQFMGGIKRTIAKEKKEMGTKTDEGKEKMSFEVYEKICEVLLKSGTVESIFTHCFLVLEWNLMARADNICFTHINHITWDDDSLVFYFMMSKGDQEGVNSKEPWHVYSNPTNPYICPILALARYVFCNPSVLNDGCKLFESRDPYQRYSKALRRILEENESMFEAMGVDIDNIGSHSGRKGSATRCSTGCTVSPPMASICLRAGWSMGPVRERYIHYEKAGDQFVGRTVCGLDCMSTDFGVSPCYFDFSSLTDEDRESAFVSIHDTIKQLTVGGMELGPKAYIITQYLYASLCYHYKFLDDTICSTDRLRQSPLFQHCSQSHMELAVIKYPWDATRETPSFTGLPPHTVMLAELRTIQEKLNQFRIDIRNEFVIELNKRDVGGGMHHATKILEKIEDSHTKILGRLERIGMQDNYFRNDCGPQQGELKNMFGPGADIKAGSSQTRLHCYNGGLHVLPKGWKLPNMTFVQFITMWLCGDRAKGVPPLRLLQTTHLKHHEPRAKHVLCAMRYLMKAVEREAIRVGKWERDYTQWTKAKTIRLYESVYKSFQFPKRRGKRKGKGRFQELNWLTIKNQLHKNKGKLIGE